MAESRDRLSRANEGPSSFGQQRQATRGLGIYIDGAEVGFGTPFRWGSTPLTGVPGGPIRAAVDHAVGSFRRRQGRGRGSGLPSWYPRVPLRDITAITRAIERRRVRSLTEPEEDPQNDSPIPPQDQIPSETSLSAQFKHNFSLNHNIADVADDFLTPGPSKSPTNYIDLVGTGLLEEIKKMKNTPSAKKAERARKVKTLMSMR